MELWRDDVVAQRWAVTAPATDGVRFETRAVLRLERDAVVTAWADADAPLPDVLPYPDARAIGFTSPRYIDRDGDGRVTVAPRPSLRTLPLRPVLRYRAPLRCNATLPSPS